MSGSREEPIDIDNKKKTPDDSSTQEPAASAPPPPPPAPPPPSRTVMAKKPIDKPAMSEKSKAIFSKMAEDKKNAAMLKKRSTAIQGSNDVNDSKKSEAPTLADKIELRKKQAEEMEQEAERRAKLFENMRLAKEKKEEAEAAITAPKPASTTYIQPISTGGAPPPPPPIPRAKTPSANISKEAPVKIKVKNASNASLDLAALEAAANARADRQAKQAARALPENSTTSTPVKKEKSQEEIIIERATQNPIFAQAMAKAERKAGTEEEASSDSEWDDEPTQEPTATKTPPRAAAPSQPLARHWKDNAKEAAERNAKKREVQSTFSTMQVKAQKTASQSPKGKLTDLESVMAHRREKTDAQTTPSISTTNPVAQQTSQPETATAAPQPALQTPDPDPIVLQQPRAQEAAAPATAIVSRLQSEDVRPAIPEQLVLTEEAANTTRDNKQDAQPINSDDPINELIARYEKQIKNLEKTDKDQFKKMKHATKAVLTGLNEYRQNQDINKLQTILKDHHKALKKQTIGGFRGLLWSASIKLLEKNDNKPDLLGTRVDIKQKSSKLWKDTMAFVNETIKTKPKLEINTTNTSVLKPLTIERPPQKGKKPPTRRTREVTPEEDQNKQRPPGKSGP